VGPAVPLFGRASPDAGILNWCVCRGSPPRAWEATEGPAPRAGSGWAEGARNLIPGPTSRKGWGGSSPFTHHPEQAATRAGDSRGRPSEPVQQKGPDAADSASGPSWVRVSTCDPR
jgi:hypothetical protein